MRLDRQYQGHDLPTKVNGNNAVNRGADHAQRLWGWINLVQAGHPHRHLVFRCEPVEIPRWRLCIFTLPNTVGSSGVTVSLAQK
jgi:hypothetical protein